MAYNQNKYTLITLLLLIITSAGCQKATTETLQPVAPFDPQVQNRHWTPQTTYYQPVAIEHETLYLTGPFEQSGGDGVFDKTTHEDLQATFASPALFLGNIIVMPVTLFVDPPFQTHKSRGPFPIEAPAYEPLALQANIHEPH